MAAPRWIETGTERVGWTLTNRETKRARASLAEDAEADVAIVGAGYLGLCAALGAARNGARVVVFDAGVVGIGASGRNGGFVVPHFPGALRPSAVERRLGARKGAALARLVAEGPDRIAALTRAHGIDADFVQTGWTQPAHSPRALAKVRAVYADWKALGAPVEWLDAEEIRARTGAAYLGGWHNPTGATLNPYAHLLGLARAAEAAGALIFEQTGVTEIAQEGPERVLLRLRAGGTDHVTRARRVLVATNGYTDPLIPKLGRSIIPARLFHTLTRPLSEEERAVVLPRRDCFTDLRKSGGFARLDPAGRLISGGAAFVSAGRGYALGHARARMAELFPALRGVEMTFDAYWEGDCGLADGWLPNLQRLRPDVFSILGFATRGVALSQNLGLLMGDVLTDRAALDEVPLERIEGVREIAFHGLKTAAGRRIFPLYRLGDRLGLS
jgi:glycine/D-amino acid oxidase-like deaminating enzyme